MAGEYGIILKVVEPIKSLLFDAVREYVGYIGSCDDNLGALHKSLGEVCNKKDDITKMVKLGNDKQEEITRAAVSWLKDVWILTEDEELKGLVYKDIETAKFVVRMMGKSDLKRRLSEESEMQGLVIKVMNKLKEEMDMSKEEMRKIAEEDYKQVAEVVVEVMKDTIEEFKKLMKEDKNMALIATRTLKDRDLDKLTKDDEEMKEIVREAEKTIDEEFHRNHKDEESNSLPMQIKIPVDMGKNTIREAAKKLFTPLTNLVTPLGKLMDDADFKRVMPGAGDVKLGLEVIDGLLIKGHGLKQMDDNTKQPMGCFCCSLSLCNNYHGRYLISKAAKLMAKHIQDEVISKYPRDPVTLRIRTIDLKPIPTQFLKGLDSRTKILHQILERLKDDQVCAVGVFGMGGTGKTTLAKEVIKKAVDVFAIKVMVEVSDVPDFVRIQAAIAESIDLPLHDVDNVAQRAVRLYSRLISEKEKILIVLDNVWRKLNLDEIGIPHTCKLLLTTRDREVCRVMDVRDINILEVGLMNTNEARELFKSQTGSEVIGGKYKNVVERLLSKCGGLPLAIVATANSLKDKDLSCWENFADDLEKPISSQISGDYRYTFSILNTSYKFIQPDGKKMFFLLVCLSPLGSSVSIESLMRYGMGLNLFEHVNNLSEAIKQAVTWANELMLSSMLLEGDVKGDVKIHDIVRDFAISCAAKEEEHRFLVEGIPRWLDDETLKKYTAMSLTAKNDYTRLSGVEACKLQILILKGDMSPNFDDFFFNGMVNLVVLALSNMKFQPNLPESMRKLKKLRTLSMEGCKLANIELVGELVNLLVLNLRESFVENLPNEVGNLCKLRLLDLSGCTSSKLPLIPSGVLSRLSRLEGLYLYNNRQSVFGPKSEYEEANAIENNRLPCLNAFEIKVAITEDIPIDFQYIEILDKFRISVGDDMDISCAALEKCCCILNLRSIKDVSGFLKRSCLRVLLKKVDLLHMGDCNNFEGLVPQLDEGGFRNLRSLHISGCNDIKYIVDGRLMNNVVAFPNLQSLYLSCLDSLEMVYNGDVSPGTFSNLQTIRLETLDKLLLYGLPLVPRNVREIRVNNCKLLKFVFTEDEVLPIELQSLKKLRLLNVPCLLSLVGPKKFSITHAASQGPQYFFDAKIVLPSLELFELDSANDVVKLWSNEIYTPGFQNLKNIFLYNCAKLSSVGSPSVLTILVHLETLLISGCDEMCEIISLEVIEELQIGEQLIRFPQLKYLELGYLSNLESFYRGESKLEFPKLEKLILDMLGSMKMFAKLENSSALFHEKIDFPCLDELQVSSVNDEVLGLWDKQPLMMESNPAPMLRQLKLGNSAGLRQIPSTVLENLSSLKLTEFLDDRAVFSSSELGENGGFVWIFSQLPNLEELEVESCESLIELFDKDCHAIDDALLLFCGQFKKLELKYLPLLNLIPLHLFKSVASLTLSHLKWNYLISTHVLEDSLLQLQSLSIRRCHNMEAFFINVGSQINLPKLKKLYLGYLGSFIGISSTPKKEASLLLPLLESLEIEYCPNLEHFWSGSLLAPKLQDLSFYQCDNLQQFLVGNVDDTVQSPCLQKVSFTGCPKINSISSGFLTTPKLREVKLFRCSNMECFLPANPNYDGDLQLPSLEIVEIYGCPNLSAFSLRPVVAPKFTQIKHNGDEYSMLPYDDLNHFLQKMNAISDSKDQEDPDKNDEGLNED